MSAHAQPAADARWSWLPAWLRPLGQEPRGEGARRRRRIEGAVLLAVFTLLAVATFNDVAHEVKRNERAAVDRRTWNSYVHRDLAKVAVKLGLRSRTDLACAAPSHTARMNICLVIADPTLPNGLRTVQGGYYVPLKAANIRRYRSGCFGIAVRRALCGS